MRQLVVIAGGFGTRLTEIGIETPKLLLHIKEQKLLDYFVDEANKSSYSDLLLILGYKSQQIIDYVESRNWPVRITIYIEERSLGTGGALVQAKHLLFDEFTVALGDLFVMDCNLNGLFAIFQQSEVDSQILIKYSNHPEDSDLVELNEYGNIVSFQKYPHIKIPELAISIAGIVNLKRHVIPDIVPLDRIDLFADVIFSDSNWIITGIFHQGIIKDVGKLDRLIEVEEQYSNYTHYNRDKIALLLDRDGTLIEDLPYNIDPRKVKALDWLIEITPELDLHFSNIAVITNQPVIARGEGTLKDVERMNNRVLELLKENNLENAVFLICPHHPDTGFTGEVRNLKVRCQCRKPEVGNILAAARDGSFFLTRSIFIGDSESDISCAFKIGAKWLHLHHGIANTPICKFEKLGNGFCVDQVQIIEKLKFLYDCVKSSL